ncbi:MAG: hypothetical protein ACYC6Y_28320, partial [Thermoguttaceae bacterium]
MSVLIWSSFVVFILAVILLYVGIFHRKPRVIHSGEAITWTVLWVALALGFNVLVYFFYLKGWFGWSLLASHRLSGHQAALQFLASYLVAKSLSVDNVLTIAAVFAWFRVPLEQQHRI